MSNSIPKKKDWTPGVAQIGVFIRTAGGATIEMVQDKASPEMLAFAVFICRELDGLPKDVVCDVKDAYNDLPTAPKKVGA